MGVTVERYDTQIKRIAHENRILVTGGDSQSKSLVSRQFDNWREGW